MARIAWPCPPTVAAAVPRLVGVTHVLLPLLLVGGCASRQGTLPTPPELTPAAMAARLLVPTDLDVNPAETVIKSSSPDRPNFGPPVTSSVGAPTVFGLADAIAFGLRKIPGCGRRVPPSSAPRARSRSPSLPSCRSSICWDSTAQPPAPWP